MIKASKRNREKLHYENTAILLDQIAVEPGATSVYIFIYFQALNIKQIITFYVFAEGVQGRNLGIKIGGGCRDSTCPTKGRGINFSDHRAWCSCLYEYSIIRHVLTILRAFIVFLPSCYANSLEDFKHIGNIFYKWKNLIFMHSWELKIGDYCRDCDIKKTSARAHM